MFIVVLDYYRVNTDTCACSYRVNTTVGQIFFSIHDFFFFVKNKKRRLRKKMGSRTRSCCIRIRVITMRAVSRLTCIVNCCLSQICYRVTTLDRHKNLVFASYL